MLKLGNQKIETSAIDDALIERLTQKASEAMSKQPRQETRNDLAHPACVHLTVVEGGRNISHRRHAGAQITAYTLTTARLKAMRALSERRPGWA